MSSTASPQNLESVPGQPTLVFPERCQPGARGTSPPVKGRGERSGFVTAREGSKIGRGAPAAGVGKRGLTASVGRGGSNSSPGWEGSHIGRSTSSFFQSRIPPGNEGDSYMKPSGRTKGHYKRFKNWLKYHIQRMVGNVKATPALMAAKTQRTPCGVNRYMLLAVYFFYSFLTARVYFAWPSLSNLLFRSDAYAWLCDPASPDLRLPGNGGRRYRCEAQNSQVGSLFVTCLTFAFSCSLLAGILLDFFGPKITALIGQLCNMLSWLLLAFAGEHAQTYFPAFIFMGVGSDIGYLPVLSSANLFPGHEGLVVACLGAAKSLSFAVPAILDIVELRVEASTLQDVSLGYVALGPGLCVLLSLLLIPVQAFMPWNEFVYLEEEPSMAAARPLVRVNDSFASYEAHAWRDSFSSFQDVKDWMHHHHLATPLEELTHSGSIAALPPLRGPLHGGPFFGSVTAATDGVRGNNTTGEQGGDNVVSGGLRIGGATGTIFSPSCRNMQRAGALGDTLGGNDTDSISTRIKYGGRATNKDMEGTAISSDVCLRSSSGRDFPTVCTSVSTEAVYASNRMDETVSGSSGSDAQLAGTGQREGGDAETGRLRHPRGGRTPESSEDEKDIEHAGKSYEEGHTKKGERGDGGELSTPVSGGTHATEQSHVTKSTNDVNVAAGGGEETGHATTGSDAGAAADEEISRTPEGACSDIAATIAAAGSGKKAEREDVDISPFSKNDMKESQEATARKGGSGGTAAETSTRRTREGRGSDGGPPGASASVTNGPALEPPEQREIEDNTATPSFRKQFFSNYAFGIIFYSVLKALMYAFFTTGGENLLGKRVNDFMGAALPFSCIPCILLGKVVDVVGIMPVLLLLNTCITLAYGFAMIPSTGTAYLGALLYICYVSFYSSQSYCYVSDTFSSCHFGKLVGTIHMIAGLLSLLKIPMQSMVVHIFHSNYLYPCVIMLVFCAANFAVLIWMVILKRKNPHPFWPQSGKDATAGGTGHSHHQHGSSKGKKNKPRETKPQRKEQAKLQGIPSRQEEKEEAERRVHDTQQEQGTSNPLSSQVQPQVLGAAQPAAAGAPAS